jgi:D-glycero-D-manno-heptose 1,7-bisphosphate phosphatase
MGVGYGRIGGVNDRERSAKKPRPAVFLDRDGVLNRAYVRGGVSHPPTHVGELEILPGVTEAVAELAAAQFPMVVVTNQPDVARGTQTRGRVEEINARVCALLPVLGVLTCYHDDSDGCKCRKPQPGLLLEAAERWHLDLRHSFMVGDRWSDIVAGQSAGCRTLLVETPQSRRHACQPDACVADLPEAANWILRVMGRGVS